MIYFRTCAFNAEKTIARTIESILAQTEPNFIYYILDNGSTDGTGRIIEEYAKKDNRIIPFFNKVNRNYEENPDFWNISYSIKDDDYFCVLDADDYYEADFAKEMIDFMKENQLDVAACGSFFENEEKEVIRNTIQPQNLFLRTKEEYDKNFASAHWYMRQIWGKLYKGSVSKYKYETELPEWFPVAYGGDTVNVLQCLKYSKGFGILAKGLHHYQSSEKSVSYKWIEGRGTSDVILNNVTREFLLEKAGRISPDNDAFLTGVYLYAVSDSLRVVLNAGLTPAKILKECVSLYGNETTLTPLRSKFVIMDAKKRLLMYQKPILEWIFDAYGKFDAEARKYAYVFFEIVKEGFSQLLSEEAMQYLMLKKPELINAFLEEKVGVIAKNLTEFVLEEKENEESSSEGIAFAMNLSALHGFEDLYIMCAKLYIGQLIKENKMEKAKQELHEWIEILPQDIEFRNMMSLVEG